MEVGKSIPRVDAMAKATGKAKYVEDYMPKGALVARVLHSEIAHGNVKSVDASEALEMPGVVRIFTCFDVPGRAFPTAGGVWNPNHKPVADRRLLNAKARFVGDDIAVVVAQDELSATRALRAMRVEYEELPAVFTPEEALAPGAPAIHSKRPDNIINKTTAGFGDCDADEADETLAFYTGEYEMTTVLHGHIETVSCGAYMESGKIVVITGNQTIFALQRVIADALDLPWGTVRVIKPYVGGSFGNRQDALYEQLAAYLTTQLGGRPVWLKLTQEETMRCTRSRHDIKISIKSGFDAGGRLITRRVSAISNQGGYASQGHNIVGAGTTVIRQLYPPEKSVRIDATTVYTNRIVAGALRGYGCSQGIFAVECHMEDIARLRGEDPCEFRLKNLLRAGYKDPVSGVVYNTVGLPACIERGKTLIDWDRKRAAYAAMNSATENTPPDGFGSGFGFVSGAFPPGTSAQGSASSRRGVGMAISCYKSSGFPLMADTSVARISLGYDGEFTLQIGAVDTGQGTETVLTQIAADAIGAPASMIRLDGVQDTHRNPYDNGSYGSRQTYVAGGAAKMAGEKMREKLISCARAIIGGDEELDIKDGAVVGKDGSIKLGMPDIARTSVFSPGYREQLTVEATFCSSDNPMSAAACFAEIEVDVPVGKIKIVDIFTIHDSGVIIHPKTAASQAQGGIGMSIGSALLEQVIFSGSGALLNNNMLDYKLPTSMDLPDLPVEFIDSYEPSGPYGNKSLGESSTLTPVAAIRNALLHATGIAFNDLPMSPQRLVERFREAGLLRRASGVAEPPERS